MKTFIKVFDILIMISLLIVGFIMLFGGEELVSELIPATIGILCFISAEYLLEKINLIENDDENEEF